MQLFSKTDLIQFIGICLSIYDLFVWEDFLGEESSMSIYTNKSSTVGRLLLKLFSIYWRIMNFDATKESIPT